MLPLKRSENVKSFPNLLPKSKFKVNLWDYRLFTKKPRRFSRNQRGLKISNFKNFKFQVANQTSKIRVKSCQDWFSMTFTVKWQGIFLYF